LNCSQYVAAQAAIDELDTIEPEQVTEVLSVDPEVAHMLDNYVEVCECCYTPIHIVCACRRGECPLCLEPPPQPIPPEHIRPPCASAEDNPEAAARAADARAEYAAFHETQGDAPELEISPTMPFVPTTTAQEGDGQDGEQEDEDELNDSMSRLTLNRDGSDSA